MYQTFVYFPHFPPISFPSFSLSSYFAALSVLPSFSLPQGHFCTSSPSSTRYFIHTCFFFLVGAGPPPEIAFPFSSRSSLGHAGMFSPLATLSTPGICSGALLCHFSALHFFSPYFHHCLVPATFRRFLQTENVTVNGRFGQLSETFFRTRSSRAIFFMEDLPGICEPLSVSEILPKLAEKSYQFSVRSHCPKNDAPSHTPRIQV